MANLPEKDGSNKDRQVKGSARFYAQTIEELGLKCGEHGPAAIAVARWGAVTTWLMDMHRSDDHVLTNPLPLAFKAVLMVSRHDRACLGYPHHSGNEHASPMDDLPSFAWEGIMQAGLETMTDWERAGCPYLDQGRIRAIQTYVHACLRNANDRDALENIAENGREGPVESVDADPATRGHLGPGNASAPLRRLPRKPARG